MRMARLLLLCVPLAASASKYASEERLAIWIRENGGFLSESVGVFKAAYGRGLRALEDIKAGEKIIDVPAVVHLDPTAQLGSHRLPQLLADSVEREAAWAAHVAKEVKRVTEAAKNPVAEGEETPDASFHDLFWASIKTHLDLLDDDPVLWKPAEQDALGREVAYLLRAERHLYEWRYDNVARFFKQGCPKKLELSEEHHLPPAAECEKIFGNIGKDEFVRASTLHKSRTFETADADMGIYVPYASLMNHRPLGINNTIYELSDSLKMWANRDIAKHEELTINYENSDNHHLLMHYGFTQPPSTEPSYYFYIPRGKPEGHPDAMKRGVVLSTPLFEHAMQGKQGRVMGVSKQLATIFHTDTEGFRNVVEAFRSQFESDEALAPFLGQLRYNRLTSPKSRVWWAEDAKRDVSDSSIPQEVGSHRASDAIRVKMCHYMCVLMYSEALTLHHNETDDPENACPVVKQLVKEIHIVHSSDYYSSESEL